MMAPYPVLDVCKYIINYCNEKDYSVSNLKLQKLLYFIQAYFLTKTGKPCFREDIEAWDFGPVVPEAYFQYKQYGAGPIPYVFYSPMSQVGEGITDQDKVYIEKVLDIFARYSATDLVTVTHRQDPWKDVYDPRRYHIKITNESIRKYFNRLNHE